MRLDLKGEKTVMNAIQIKDEIRKLNRSDKIEIFRWIDLEIADDLVCRIGMDRSLQIRQEIEQKCKVTTIEKAYTPRRCSARFCQLCRSGITVTNLGYGRGGGVKYGSDCASRRAF
jgi:hypothetical protein